MVKQLNFHDRPEEKHVIRHRDVIEAIRCLWGDPALAKYLVLIQANSDIVDRHGSLFPPLETYTAVEVYCYSSAGHNRLSQNFGIVHNLVWRHHTAGVRTS